MRENENRLNKMEGKKKKENEIGRIKMREKRREDENYE